MSTYAEIIKKKKKDWNCEGLMDGHNADRGQKLPFSSPLMNWATYGGIPRNKITEFFGDPGGGKAQPLYSKVLTPDGFVNMGDVKVGDLVFDGSGNICKVDGVYPQGVRPVYEIKTQGNNTIRVADNHINSVWWWNETKHCREDFEWTTDVLLEKFKQYGKWRRIRVDTPSLEWEETPVRIDPYLLGALLGDGGLSQGGLSFSNCESDILDKVNSLLSYYDYELINYTGIKQDWSIRVRNDKYKPGVKTKFVNDLEFYNLRVTSINKHIPKDYLLNSRNVRLSLLQGLMDTDGHIQKDGVVEFSTSSKQLSCDFSFLVQSLGIRDTVVASVGKYKDDAGNLHECNISYQHLLKVPNDLCIVSSAKHLARRKLRQHDPIRNIIDIQYIGDEECQCIHVDSPLHTYISDNFIPTHNTTTAVDICKNCIEIFNKEYSDKVDSLREQIASGNKSAVSELADLEDFGPKKVLYIDLEHSFDAAWSKTLGIDESDIDVMQPPDTTAEEIMQTILDIIETGEVGMIVLDSIPSLVPKTELEKNIGERTVSALAGPLSVFCRKVVSLLTRYECTLLMINQIRDNMDNPYVVNTPGGKAPKFYSSLRIQFRIGAPVDFLGIEQPQKFESPSGYLIKAQIVKQKSAPWDRKQATYYLMCKSGIRPDFDYANLAINKYGIICKKAAWFTFTDPQTGEILENESGMPVKVNGLARVYDYLKEHPDYYDKLKDYITNDINGASSDE